jgi:stage II sporulation protein D
MADGRSYRGRLNVMRGISGVLVVNRVPLESYVAGTIGAEMGARRPEELAALRAQAVVSRTFAVRNRGRWEAQGLDAFADVRDQVYGGLASESPQVWDAVRATGGEVLEYQGLPIDAFFHSTCGGTTAGVEEVFATAASRPYLRPVSDARGGGRHYCDISPRFRWREEWDASTLRTILSRTLPAVMNIGGDGLQPITDVEVARTTRSGRVGELRIVFEHGDVRVPGSSVRTVLRPANGRLLGSQAFELHVSRDGDRVSRLLLRALRDVHVEDAVLQWGAVGRARRAGLSHDTGYVLPGTRVEKLYYSGGQSAGRLC